MSTDDLHCLCCNRPTHNTDNTADPLRTREAPSGAYVLCARCEDVARAEVGAPAIAEKETTNV